MIFLTIFYIFIYNVDKNINEESDIEVGIELINVEIINSSIEKNNIYFILSYNNISIKCICNEYRWGLLEIYPIEKGITYNFSIKGYYYSNNKLKNFTFVNGNNSLDGAIYFDGKYKTEKFNQSIMKYIEVKDLTYYCSEIKIKGNDGIITILISLPHRSGIIN